MAAAPSEATATPAPAPEGASEGLEEKPSFFVTLKTFPRSFWMGCVIEMWERLAYYGVRVVVPIYIMQADEPGGLHFTKEDKGSIYAWWFLVGGVLPTLTGGLADRYGYKRLIALSAAMNVAAFTLMANLRSFAGFFTAVMLLAAGTALFKPALQGTLAQSMTSKNSSVGWGLFYWLVNVGAAIGPPFAGFLHGHGWKFVFYGSAAVTSLNFLMLLTYPTVESGAEKQKKIARVAWDTLKNLADARLLALIAIFTGFWMMLYQLWDFMPNFYADWVQSSAFVAKNGWLPTAWLQLTPRGIQLKQENALNLNAALIVLFVIPMSFVARRLRVLTAITIGISIATVGTIVYGTSPSITFVFAGIVLFSLGEMLTGPKKTEYFALIAPKGKKALYLGYVNIPVAFGGALGAKIVGWKYGEKATLALRYLAEKTSFVQGRGAWDGDVDHLEAFVGVKRTAALETLTKVLGTDAQGATQILWDSYQPYRIWYFFAAVGFASLLGMLLFGRLARRWKGMDV